jgi:uncharacterized membrane protein YedE/YeeE
MTEFTPLASLLGGAMIGLASVLLMAWEGRVAGISGIAGRLLPPYRDGAFLSRLGFVGGLAAAPLLSLAIGGQPVQQTISADLPMMAAAGLIVGYGSTWGNGCTSGHGVCGLSRLSKRSFVATVVFMSAAFVTVYVNRHVIGA